MVKIKKTKDGFDITRTPCVVCGELPFGDDYCCGHPQVEVTLSATDVTAMTDAGYDSLPGAAEDRRTSEAAAHRRNREYHPSKVQY